MRVIHKKESHRFSYMSLRTRIGFTAVTLALLVLPLAQVAADAPSAFPLVTDHVNLSLSDKFTQPGQMALDDNGDVVFVAGGHALFHWDAGTGARARLLQAKDPYPGFPGSATDIIGNALQVNSAGHAAMINFFSQKEASNPRGVFVYDGTGFQLVALRGDVAPGTGGQIFINFGSVRINNNDEVAFIGDFEPPVLGSAGLFVGTPGGPVSKIAALGETAPGTGGGTYDSFSLIGINDNGDVAFLSDIAGGVTARAIFISTSSGISKVAAQNDPAPGTTGTFNLVFLNPFNYALNSNGDVAFAAAVAGGGPATQGIWIGNASAAPTKLILNNDPTMTSLGGSFGLGVLLHAFNDAGKVLFRTNPVGATSNHALFLKDLSSAAEVVFARNQPAPGGTTEVFFNTLQATMNDAGGVAFLAQLQSGPAPVGWFLRNPAGTTTKIVLQGDASPIGGTFGLAGSTLPAQINSSSQVAFFADVLGPNAIGAFLFTPGGGIASIVNTNDTLPAGANTIIRPFMPAASDDLLLFYGHKAGGRFTAFTKPLKSGGGGITRLFGEGDIAPGIGGALFGTLPNFGLINDNEEAAFVTNEVIGGATYPGSIIFTHAPGVGLRKVAASGDAAPGAAGGTFTNFNLVTLTRPPSRINNAGQVAFQASIVGSAGLSSQSGIFIGSAGGSIQPIARMGDPSPIGGIFANFQNADISLNEAGQVAFRGLSQIIPPPAQPLPAIFIGSAGSPPQKVVAANDPGPGGSTFSVIPQRFQINNAGQAAYVAGLSGGGSPEGIFLGTAGGPQQVVALAADPAPNTGGAFGDFREADIELNNLGRVAFWAEITGSIVKTGYFLGSATGSPVARLVEGQSLPGGSVATFLTPGINNFIGEPFALTDSGEMCMNVSALSGVTNRFRLVIADSGGALRQFITPGEKAEGTGSTVSGFIQAVNTNSEGRFFVTVVMVEGPSRYGIFWNAHEANLVNSIDPQRPALRPYSIFFR